MTPTWFRALSLFILVNLIAVPIADHLAWDAMLRLNARHGPLMATGLSLLTAGVILLVNILLIRAAVQAGLPKLGELALWIVTGLTFALTIGTGRFSPLNFLVTLAG
ncbi:MAG: hypothetical protein AAF415_02785 [Pseudomonadota bacterium]